MATSGLLEIKLFLNKGYDVIIYVYNVPSKILSCDSNYIVDVVMWPKVGSSSISMRKVISFIFIRIWPEKPIFWRVVWFKFNNLGLILCMALKFYNFTNFTSCKVGFSSSTEICFICFNECLLKRWKMLFISF